MQLQQPKRMHVRTHARTRTQRVCIQLCETALCDCVADTVISGIGYHHAGMDLHDRKLIEELFTRAHLPVLCKFSILWFIFVRKKNLLFQKYDTFQSLFEMSTRQSLATTCCYEFIKLHIQYKQYIQQSFNEQCNT